MMTMSEAPVAASKKPLTRFGEFDLLKALAILGLPAVHLMEEAMEGGFVSPGLANLGNVVIFLCAFGPSVFMICMGFGIGGGKTPAKNIRANGFQFLVIGMLLDIFRWLLPGLVQSIALHRYMLQDIDFCLQSDIYYFAGLYFILYSYFKQWKIQIFGILLISLLMLALNTLLTPVTGRLFPDLEDNDPTKDSVLLLVGGSILGNFVYVDHTSCFPLLSWAIFPSVGVLLGEILKKTDEEQRAIFMRRILCAATVVVVSFLVFLWSYKIDILKVLVSPANKYITDLPNVILLVSLALMLVSAFYYLCKRIGSSRFMAYMLRISTFIIPFYLLQWLIVSWIVYLMTILKAPAGCLTTPIYLACVAVITAFCMFITSRYGMKIMKQLLRITSFKRRKKANPEKTEIQKEK